MDWRKAGRPERQHISDPVGYSALCFGCERKIEAEYASAAPSFNQKGERNLI